MVNNEVKDLVVIATLIFLIAPIAILIYILLYNKRKKRHLEEKEQMKLTFDAELIKAQHEIREQTMQTIGADLHDNIGQILSLTALTLKSIEATNPAKILPKVKSSIELVSRSIQEMRLLGSLLQGDQLIAKGIDQAIKQEINWIKKSGNYSIKYIQEGENTHFDDSSKTLILFRIIQESLNNTIKHAQANQIKITLKYLSANLELSIKDNGLGFDSTTLDPYNCGMGLQNIQKRAALIGGTATINTAPNKGTTIIILIPYR